MRIGIDARLAVGKRRGMGRALVALLRHLHRLDRANQYLLYLDRPDMKDTLPTVQNYIQRVLGPRLYPAWEQLSLPITCKRDRLDLLHCPANTAPIVVPRPVKLVVTLHDVIFLKPLSEIPLSKNHYQNLGRLYRCLCARAMKKRVDLFLTDSEWSRQDIQVHLGIEPERVRVIPGGVDDCFFDVTTEACTPILHRLGVTFPYILHLGATAPHKNTLRAIEAYSLLAQDACYRDIRLVVVGMTINAAHKVTSSLHSTIDLLKRIIFLGYVSDDELACLYKGAQLFLFPSLYEGFGLPPLEAMASGTPVVASNRCSIPEVVGDAAVLVDPTDPEEISNAMRMVLEDPALRAKMSSAGRTQAMKFRWQVAAKDLLAAYE